MIGLPQVVFTDSVRIHAPGAALLNPPYCTVTMSLLLGNTGGGQRGRKGRLASPAKRQQSRVRYAASHCVRHLIDGLIVEAAECRRCEGLVQYIATLSDGVDRDGSNETLFDGEARGAARRGGVPRHNRPLRASLGSRRPSCRRYLLLGQACESLAHCTRMGNLCLGPQLQRPHRLSCWPIKGPNCIGGYDSHCSNITVTRSSV